MDLTTQICLFIAGIAIVGIKINSYYDRRYFNEWLEQIDKD